MKKILFLLLCSLFLNNSILNSMNNEAYTEINIKDEGKNIQEANIQLSQKITPKKVTKKINTNNCPSYCCELCLGCIEHTPKCSSFECFMFTNGCLDLCMVLAGCFAACLDNHNH